MEIIRDKVQMDRFVQCRKEAAQLEGNVTLQEDQQDILRVVSVGARLIMGSAETLQDTVMMAGKVLFEVLYTAIDGSVEALEAETEFSHKMQLEGVKPGMRARVVGAVRQIDYNMEGARNLTLSADLVLDVCVVSVEPMDWVRNITGVEGIQMQTEPVTGVSTVEEQVQEVVVSDDVDIPQRALTVDEVLHNQAYINVRDVANEGDHVQIEGEMLVHTLYMSNAASGLPQLLTYSVPVSVQVSWNDAVVPQGDLEVQVVVDDIDVTPQLDDMEEKRVLRVEAALTATATVREQVDEVLLRDAYAPGRVIDVSAGEVALLQQKERQSTQQTYRFALPLPDGLPPISRALMLSARPVVQEVSATDKGVRVSGVIACDVVYHSDEESMPIFGYHASEPFECDLGMSCDTTDAQLGALANVAQANCTAVSDEEVDCRVALDIEAYCTPVVTRDVVSEVTDGGEATGGADYGIVLVVVQHDDTLWSVARKFNATVDEVTQLNPYLKERELHPGDKVLMYRPFRPAKRA